MRCRSTSVLPTPSPDSDRTLSDPLSMSFEFGTRKYSGVNEWEHRSGEEGTESCDWKPLFGNTGHRTKANKDALTAPIRVYLCIPTTLGLPYLLFLSTQTTR
jgi:hypothetical protein